MEPMATVNCVYCQTMLSYPANSLYIQCPKCQNTMNPAAPHAAYVNCIGCTTLLSHPPTSLTIQCPKCLMVMDLPARLNPAGGGMGGGGVDPNRKSRKKRKDPNAPKRATNAYMVFCKERRALLKEERPDLAFGKLGATLGEMWRKMSPEEKKPYESRASGDRERYKSEMGSYQSASMLKGNAMQQLGMSQEDVHSVLSGHANPAKKQKLEDGGAAAMQQLGMAMGGMGGMSAMGGISGMGGLQTMGGGPAAFGLPDLGQGQIDPSQIDMSYYVQLQQQQQQLQHQQQLVVMQQQMQQQQQVVQQQQQQQQQLAAVQAAQQSGQLPVGSDLSTVGQVQSVASFEPSSSSQAKADGDAAGGEEDDGGEDDGEDDEEHGDGGDETNE